jgi:hypothetical protein
MLVVCALSILVVMELHKAWWNRRQRPTAKSGTHVAGA